MSDRITYTIPFLAEGPVPKTLDDVVKSIDKTFAAGKYKSHKSAKRHVSAMRTTAKRIAGALGRPIHQIPLEELVEVDDLLLRHVASFTSDKTVAVQYLCDKDKLLQHAKHLGWTCPSFELRDAWTPIRLALRGKSAGAGGIIDFGIRLSLYPNEFDQEAMDRWEQTMLGMGRAHVSIVATVTVFRRLVLKAGLSGLFPLLNLKSRNPEEYTVAIKDMPASIQKELIEIQHWKQARYVRGRDAKLAVRPATMHNLIKALRQLYGFAVNILELKDIRTYRDLLRRETICSFIVWLSVARRCKRSTITARLNGIHALAVHHPLFAGINVDWFLPQLRKLPKEHPDELKARKGLKYRPYAEVAEIPGKILAQARDSAEDPVAAAWRFHDALFMSWPLHLPWRQRNLRECGIARPASVNLFFASIPADQRHRLELSPEVLGALKADPRRKFWQVVFDEDTTKAGIAVYRVVPEALVPMLAEYLERHRPLLVGSSDPGTLFLNRDGHAMWAKDVLRLVTNMTLRHIGHRITPHILRDIYAAHFLLEGGEIEVLMERLWHEDVATSENYTGQINSAHGAIELDNYLIAA